MDLAEHTDQPTEVIIGGKSYLFAELDIDAMGRLQAWIKAHVPHPMKVVREHLDDFTPAQQEILLAQARKEAAHWPPAIGTQEAAQALASSPDGMLEVLWEGLKGADPETPRETAKAIFRKIRRDEAKSREVYGLIYGSAGDEAPKA